MTIMFVLPLFIILFVGILILSLNNSLQKTPLLIKIAYAYGVGIGCITLQMMIYSLLGISWHTLWLIMPWILVFIGVLLFKKKLLIHKLSFTYTFGFIDSCILLGIILTICFVVIEAMLRPLMAFDAWANWFLAGKAYFLSGNINPNYIIYADNSNPPLINIMIAFIYRSMGQSNEQMAILFFTFFYIFLLVIFYFYARKFMSSRYALLFTFFLATLENVIRHAGRYDVGYADLPLAYFVFCSSILLIEYIKTKSLKYFFLFNLFITVTGLIKGEGLSFFIILEIISFFTFFSLKKDKLKYILIFMGSLILYISWYIFNKIQNLPENVITISTIKFSRTFTIFYYMLNEYLNIVRWNLLWIGFFTCLLFFTKNKTTLILGIICLLQLFVYFLVYLMTPLPVIDRMNGSFDRLLLHITPLAMLMISIIYVNFSTIKYRIKKKQLLTKFY